MHERVILPEGALEYEIQRKYWSKVKLLWNIW